MIKIINNTDLFYKEIGEIIDNIQWDSRGETQYLGKVDVLRIQYKRQHLKIQIRILKKWSEWRFDNENQKNG